METVPDNEDSADGHAASSTVWQSAAKMLAVEGLGAALLGMFLPVMKTSSQLKVSDLCYPIGRGVSIKGSLEMDNYKKPVIRQSDPWVTDWPVNGLALVLPANVKYVPVYKKTRKTRRSAGKDEVERTRSSDVDVRLTAEYVTAGAGHSRANGEQHTHTSLDKGIEQQEIVFALHLESVDGDANSKYNLDKAVEDKLPQKWDPVVLAEYITNHGLYVATKVEVGTGDENYTTKVDDLDERGRGSVTNGNLGVKVNGRGASIDLNHQNSEVVRDSHSREVDCKNEFGESDKYVILRIGTKDQADLVVDDGRQRTFKYATRLISTAAKRWSRNTGREDTSQQFSLEKVPLATFLEFQRVSELTLATNEASAMPGDSSIPSGVVPFFQKGWKKYYVDTRIVQMPGGVPVGCGFTTGHDDDTLALGLEHTCQTPTGCGANWDQCVKEGEWVGTQRGITTHQKFQGIEVNTSEVRYVERSNDNSKVHMLTAARLDLSKSSQGKPVLSIRARYSALKGAQYVHREWDKRNIGSGDTTQSRSASPSDTEDLEWTSRGSKLSKHVFLERGSRGPNVEPGHWVLIGLQLQVVEGKLRLRRKFALLEFLH